MNDVLKYIHNHIRDKLIASDVAEAFGYSRWYFCARFRAFTGRTFVEYVRHYRMQLAALEILSGERITDVAVNCGYDAVSGFSKAFLKVYGCMPGEYRKQVRESQLYYEMRRSSMFQLSDRCAMLREEAVERRECYMKQYGMQSNIYTVLGQYEAKQQGLENAEITAAGMARSLNCFTPFIAPGELVVGFNFGEEEYGEYSLPQKDETGLRKMKENGISDEDAKLFFEISARKEPLMNWIAELPLTAEEKQMNDEWAGIGRCISSNHTVLGYERVLKMGFEGLLREVEKYEAVNGSCAMYRAMKMILNAAVRMGEKYAEKAEELLKDGGDAYHPEDLKKIIAVCRKAPRRPAESFLEAVQTLWFAHIVNTWEDKINANSLGRLDQILYPYYKKDIESGVLTKEEAFEIICCLWIKLYRDYDVQQSCLGGTDADGRSMVNELSYMMLDATEQLNFIRCLSVRYSKNTEKEFLQRALEVVGHVQKGVPFFFNDDIMIPALMSKGIPHADACGYTQIGCVETVIPGKSNPHAVTGETNLLKALEYVLGNGCSMMYPEFRPGIAAGELNSFKTYDQLYQAVLVQIERILDLTCSVVVKTRKTAVVNAPKPYKSLLTEGCLESGRDFNDAGALYDYYQIMLGGIPNLADSLMVIRKFVYQEQKYTLQQLKRILEKDYPDEAVRAEFINKAPKFGNDIDEVDEIAADIMDRACDMLDRMSEKYGLSFHAQPFTFLWMIDHGRCSAASPDGRRKGEPIAYSCSPMQGRDFSGLTALLNSIAKLPSAKAPGTTSAIVEVDPKLFCDRNIGLMTDILIAASMRGLCNVQFNVIDADTLIDAQKHPDKYSNLAVRVSGFSQKFNLLTPELQNHIIGRTKHRCL